MPHHARSIDEPRLIGLMADSDDLQSDMRKASGAGLASYVDAARSQGGSSGSDVATLQTAASLENLAVGTYKTALTLPFIGGATANPVVKAFVAKTMSQHAEHAQAFNAATQKLGGPPQNGVPPKYQTVVTSALPGIKGPADVVALAITLENVAAQTYTKDVGLASTAELRQLFASVAGVESQHVAILYAVQALLKAGAPELIALPPDASKLPAAAGGVGFPNSFYPTAMAADPQDGAVK